MSNGYLNSSRKADGAWRRAGIAVCVWALAAACGSEDKGSKAEPKPIAEAKQPKEPRPQPKTMQLAGPIAQPKGTGAAVMGEAAHAFAPGASAPQLKLPNAAGEAFDLAKVLEAGPVVVVFYRGDWCPKCKKQLTELAAAADQFKAKGATLVAVSVDPGNKAAAFAKLTGAQFEFLIDAELEAIRAWQVEDVGEKIAKPASFVVGKDGKVRFAHVGKGPADRPTAQELLDAL